MIDVNFLSSMDLFAEVQRELLEPIVKESNVRELQRGDFLFSEGDDANDLFIVLEGRVAIANRSFDGRESVVALMEAGDLFGEMVLLKENRRYGTVQSDNFTDVLVMNYSDIFGLYKTNPRIFSLLILNLSRLLAGRLQGAGKRISNLVMEIEKNEAA